MIVPVGFRERPDPAHGSLFAQGDYSMKITLDRRSCNCWQAACDSHFGCHFLGEEISPIECLIDVAEDGKEELSFYIYDRDGVDKTLVVNEENRAEAWDSWYEAWEKQQAALKKA
jgi:hypothetical protein